jgi:RNA polymerase sigma-70 factor (ECF subfamily)
MTGEEEAALVAAAKQGSAAAFGRLVDLHGGAVRAFLRRLTHNAADADDLAQEAFACAWERLHRFEGRARFRTWVCAIAWRVLRGAKRARARAKQRDHAYWLTSDSTGDDGAALEARVRASMALAALPDVQRAAVTLCLILEFTHAEAAEALALPLGTVKSHVARGREKLAALLSERKGG